MARAADERLARGEGVTPLTGVPIALKDLLCTQGVTTTCGSHILDNYTPRMTPPWSLGFERRGPYFSERRIWMSSPWGPSKRDLLVWSRRKPLEPAGGPGRSSGGSAAAVAAGGCAGAWAPTREAPSGSPPPVCGIVGLKPTYGRVSRFGLVAFASSLDQIGP